MREELQSSWIVQRAGKAVRRQRSKCFHSYVLVCFGFFSGISELFVKLKEKLMTWETLFFHNCLSSRSRLHISVIKVSPANKLADSLHWSAISASFVGKLIHCIPANLPLRMQEGINTQSSFVFLKIRFSRREKKKRKERQDDIRICYCSQVVLETFSCLFSNLKNFKNHVRCAVSQLELKEKLVEGT